MARKDSLGSARTAMVLQDSLEASLAPPPHLQPQDRETQHLKGMDKVEYSFRSPTPYGKMKQ